MAADNRAGFAVPILIIAVGVGWLLTALGYGPGINWVWTLGLGTVGILTFVLSGIDKASVVVGPFFLLASVLSVLRQTDAMSVNVEVPVLVIGVGVLLLVVRHPAVPAPEWLTPLPPPADEPPRPKRLTLDPRDAAPPADAPASGSSKH
ncbi:hypothetical protein J0H58_15640 [bacterium]|nr:hypothetical protein [bacterium]